MPAVPTGDTAVDAQVTALERELERARGDEAAAWGRYNALRRRKVVRAALALANARRRAGGLLKRSSAARAPAVEVNEAAAPATPAPDEGVAHPWPLGHFYSPVPDTVALGREPDRSRVWAAGTPELPGIDWNADAQLRLVREQLASQEPLRFAARATGDPTEYHESNELFSPLDAWALQAMLRHLEPARMIEVGSGWSSLVTARVNRELRGGDMDVTCIEPFVPDFLAGGVDGITRVLPTRVQDVPVERFLELEAGDVLFIDSSHVVKTGSDARYLYHEVLPRLRAGVVVHAHDIFLPAEYPEQWVLSGRGWNEQYILQSFLAFNSAFEVLLAMAWLASTHPDTLEAAGFSAARVRAVGAGSFWMRRR